MRIGSLLSVDAPHTLERWFTSTVRRSYPHSLEHVPLPENSMARPVTEKALTPGAEPVSFEKLLAKQV